MSLAWFVVSMAGEFERGFKHRPGDVGSALVSGVGVALQRETFQMFLLPRNHLVNIYIVNYCSHFE